MLKAMRLKAKGLDLAPGAKSISANPKNVRKNRVRPATDDFSHPQPTDQHLHIKFDITKEHDGHRFFF
jgi:hypothetical protein